MAAENNGQRIVDREIARLKRSSGSLKGEKAPGRMQGVHFVTDPALQRRAERNRRISNATPVGSEGGTKMTPDK